MADFRGNEPTNVLRDPSMEISRSRALSVVVELLRTSPSKYEELSQLSRPEGSCLYLLHTFGFPVSSFPLTASSRKFVNVPNPRSIIRRAGRTRVEALVEFLVVSSWWERLRRAFLGNPQIAPARCIASRRRSVAIGAQSHELEPWLRLLCKVEALPRPVPVPQERENDR